MCSLVIFIYLNEGVYRVCIKCIWIYIIELSNNMDGKILHLSISSVSTTLPACTGYLRPSRELLEYYRKKISEYDGEYDKLLQKLDKYKCTYEQVVRITFESW